MQKFSSIDIFGMRLDMVQTPEVVETMKGWINGRHYHNYITVLTANEAVLGKHESRIRDTVNCSNLAVADGISLILFSRLHGYNLKRRVYGPDLLIEFLKSTENNNYSHFFYGATDNVNKNLILNLKQRFPKIKVAGYYSPPFRQLTQDEENKIINIINDLSPDILWVGLGGITQQLWMHKHKNKLRVPVMVGVGAAFDFLAGTKLQAPSWIRDNGFEWLFRLITEPTRLWRRYIVNGSLFICYLIEDLISNVLCPSKSKSKIYPHGF